MENSMSPRGKDPIKSPRGAKSPREATSPRSTKSTASSASNSSNSKHSQFDSVKIEDKHDPRLLEINKGQSLLQQEARKRGLVEKLKDVKLTRLDVEVEPIVLAGPFHKIAQDPSYGLCYATALSTYPQFKGARSRDGDPICDSYRIHTFQNGSIMCLCDGCGWGEPSRQASNRIKDNFIVYMTKQAPKIRSVREMGEQIINALAFCHYAIFYDKEELIMAGYSTCVGGVLVETSIEAQNESPFHFVFASVGDCKAFRYNCQTRKFTDLTPGNRLNLTDPRDPGGRLGPWKKPEGHPDLRNLDLYYVGLNVGDMILLVSDGVHDNFDPQVLAKDPREVGLDADSWETVDEKIASPVKTAFMNDLITATIVGDGEEVIPSIVAKKLVRHCRDTTGPTRQFMEQNPNARQPQTSKSFPGKVDHVSLIALQVGRCESGAVSVVQKSLNPLVWPF